MRVAVTSPVPVQLVLLEPQPRSEPHLPVPAPAREKRLQHQLRPLEVFRQEVRPIGPVQRHHHLHRLRFRSLAHQVDRSQLKGIDRPVAQAPRPYIRRR